MASDFDQVKEGDRIVSPINPGLTFTVSEIRGTGLWLLRNDGVKTPCTREQYERMKFTRVGTVTVTDTSTITYDGPENQFRADVRSLLDDILAHSKTQSVAFQVFVESAINAFHKRHQ